MFVTIPFVNDDEFCYWSIAAFFNKLDWSGVTQYCAYYNWGYSTILAIVLRCSSNILMAYKIAIILNGIWMCITYNLIIEVWYLLSGKRDSIWLPNCIALITCLFPNILTHTSITWPECFAILLCWLTIYTLVKFSCGCGKKNVYFFNLVIIVLYLVHKRFLGFLIAAVFLDCILMLQKKITKKDLFSFALLMLLGIYINEIVKTVLITSLWKNSSTVVSNNMEGQMGKLVKIFNSLDGLFTMLMGFLGQVYAITIETGTIALIGGVFLVRKLFDYITRKDDTSSMIVYLYIILSILMTMGISVIFLSERNRVDHLVYVRYIAVTMQLLFIFGIMKITQLENNNISIMKVFPLALITIGSAYVLQNTISYEKLYSFNQINSTLLWFFWHLNKNLILPSLLLMVFLVVFLKCKALNAKVAFCLLFGIVGGFYGVVQFETDRNFMKQTNNDFRMAYSIIEKLGTAEKTYYLLEKNVWKDRGKNVIQFLEPYITIEGIKEKNIDLIDAEDVEIVLWNNNKYIYDLQLTKGFRQEQSACSQEETLVVLNNVEMRERKIQLNLYDMNIGSSIVRESFSIRQQTVMGEDVVLAFGPYIYLSDGEYILNIDMTVLDNEIGNTSLGFIVVAGESGTYALENIALDNFEGQKGAMQITVKLPDDESKFEVAIYSKAGSLLQLDGIEIGRVN